MKKDNIFITISILLFLSIIIVFIIIINNVEPEIQDRSDNFVFPKIVIDKKQEKSNNHNNIYSSISKADSYLLLPDLQVAKIDEVFIIRDDRSNKILRFPGTFINLGDGPLELVGAPNYNTKTINVTQNIYGKDGIEKEEIVGSFVFHEDHKHWHFENFVKFELYSVKNNIELDEKIASTGKITYCIHDNGALFEDVPGKPKEGIYPGCNSEIQGISVGWFDRYVAEVPGQELNISDVKDGVYAFVTIVDPENRIYEKNENNNSSISYIRITGDRVEIIGDL